MPSASTTTERLPPCLARSTGLGPAVWPPQGVLVMQRRPRRDGQLKAEQTVVGAQDEQAQLLGKAKGDPLVAAATKGGC